MILSLIISAANAGCFIWGVEVGQVGAAEYVNLFFAMALAFIAGMEK